MHFHEHKQSGISLNHYDMAKNRNIRVTAFYFISSNRPTIHVQLCILALTDEEKAMQHEMKF